MAPVSDFLKVIMQRSERMKSMNYSVTKGKIQKLVIKILLLLLIW